MDIEGQKSPRDVASENEKHPWEVFPEGESSAEKGEKKRKKENKKAKKVAGWLKTHIILTTGMVLCMIAIIVGTIFAIKMATKPEVKGLPEGETIELKPTVGKFVSDIATAKNPDLAFDYAEYQLSLVAYEDIYTDGTYDADLGKLEDNIDIFIKNIDNDYDKVFYTLIKAEMIAEKGDPTRGEALIELFNEKNYELDYYQRFTYLVVVRYIAYLKEDTEKYNEYTKIIMDEYHPDEWYIDEDTGEPLTEEEAEQINERYEKKEAENEE